MITWSKFAKAVLVEVEESANTTSIIGHQQAALIKKPSHSRADYNFSNYCSQ